MSLEEKKDLNDPLLLENQVCFPLYACARRVVNAYSEPLKVLGITYTQYVTMIVMWEHHKIAVKDLCKILYLDSGTITPVLKKLCSLGYLKKYRDEADERVVIAELTSKGKALREKAKEVPLQMSCHLRDPNSSFDLKNAADLKVLLLKLLENLD